MRRPWLVILLTLLLLWALVAQLNHYLAVWHIYVFLGALFVTFAALHLTWRDGMILALFGGLLCDANSGAPFGAHLLFFATLQTVLFHFRSRLRETHPLTRTVVAFLANLLLFVALSAVMAAAHPVILQSWPRLLLDLLASQLLLALAAPWFFAIQDRALAFASRGDPRLF